VSAPATTLLTYVWHYVVARLLYDDLVRPLTRGGVATAVAAVGCVVLFALLGRSLRRRRS
jgi:hypothetical protein